MLSETSSAAVMPDMEANHLIASMAASI
jgi:hypothetical protein